MLKKILFGLVVLVLIFILYVVTFFKSGLNTLRTNPNESSIDYVLIEEDLSKRENYFTWIGQATILLNIDNLNILFDPIFNDRASPFKNIGPKRNVPPAITINKLPKIDLIFISHNHYDHLDLESLINIQNLHKDVKIYVPKGDKKLLKKSGLINIEELNWWERREFKNIEITFTPTKHWSARGLFDRNQSLWGAWFVQTNDLNLLHIGDTAYDDIFKTFKEKLGNIDLTFMPIGSYFPRDIEAEYHVDPHEAIQLSKDLESGFTYGIHWGGIFFTQEPTYEPQEIINKAMMEDPSLDFHTSLPGIIIDLPQRLVNENHSH